MMSDVAVPTFSLFVGIMKIGSGANGGQRCWNRNETDDQNPVPLSRLTQIRFPNRLSLAKNCCFGSTLSVQRFDLCFIRAEPVGVAIVEL
jgi:hypothetical protein